MCEQEEEEEKEKGRGGREEVGWFISDESETNIRNILSKVFFFFFWLEKKRKTDANKMKLLSITYLSPTRNKALHAGITLFLRSILSG